jgi:hypothetical protein
VGPLPPLSQSSLSSLSSFFFLPSLSSLELFDGQIFFGGVAIFRVALSNKIGTWWVAGSFSTPTILLLERRIIVLAGKQKRMSPFPHPISNIPEVNQS